MPVMSDKSAQESRLLRMFLYGKGKTKKTTWACKAAELGYNVLHIDGDDGAHVLWQEGIINHDAWGKITTVNVVDTLDRAVFASFMARFCKDGNEFIWDEQKKQIAFASVADPNHSHISFCPSLLTPNDIIITDSWTMLSASSMLSYAKEQNIDLSEADKTEWGGYGFQNRFLDFVIRQLKALPCHVIVIGHATTYEKYSNKDLDPTGKARIISQTVQPISSTGPHAQKLDGSFSDVLYFSKISDTAYYINTGGSKDRVGGSRHFDGAEYPWRDFSIAKFFAAANSIPAQNSPPTGWQFFEAGEKPVNLIVPAKPVLVKSAAVPITPQVGAAVKMGGGFLDRLKKSGGAI